MEWKRESRSTRLVHVARNFDQHHRHVNEDEATIVEEGQDCTAQVCTRFARRAYVRRLCFSSYDLPHRIHVAQIYPITSPNGSTIIIYGHDNGIRVLWRGGQPLKQAGTPKTVVPRVDATNNDSIMIIDSDDEQPQSSAAPGGEAVYKSEEEEFDPFQPYPPIVQHIDLTLDTEVLHLALPRIPSVTPLRSAESIPPLFSQKIVCTVACADCSVRVITLPLAPPSESRKMRQQLGKDESRWGEEMVTIGGQSGHQSIPNSVSMTWTVRGPTPSVDDVGVYDGDRVDETDSRSAPRRLGYQPSSQDDVREWDLLIASHSLDITGLLLITRIPLVSEGDWHSIATGHAFPSQTKYLSSPASRVVFNPSHYPSKRHSQLLVADTRGIVRIYDPLTLPRARLRSSRQEVDTEKTGEHGSWLASFMTSFVLPKHFDAAASDVAQRKHVVDAQWASGGRGIIILLTDGEWGIWDVGDSGPGANRALSFSSFAVRGFVGAASPSSFLSSSTQPKARESRSLLAPMTPNTRKSKQEVLFSGPPSDAAIAARGGISVSDTPSTTGGRPEESVVLWYGNDIYSISSLQTYWSRSVNSSGGNAGSLYGPGLTRVEGLSTFGELISGIAQLAMTGAAARAGTQRDLLIAAESRLILLSSSTPQRESITALFSREREQADGTGQVDQRLLARGELDLGGMDRLLDGMDAGSSVAVAARRVGFAT